MDNNNNNNSNDFYHDFENNNQNIENYNNFNQNSYIPNSMNSINDYNENNLEQFSNSNIDNSDNLDIIIPKKNNRRQRVFKTALLITFMIIIGIISIVVLAKMNIIKLPWIDYPEAIKLSQNEVMLKRNTSYQFLSDVYPSKVNFGRVIYESSNPDVATVNPITGFIEAKTNGIATIKAYLEDYRDISDTCELVVSNNNVMVEEITVENENINMVIGNEYILKYSYTPQNAGLHHFTYVSSDESILTVNPNGKVTALKEGRAVVNIIEENSDKTASQEFTVYSKGNENVKKKDVKIKVSTNNVYLSVGGEQQVTAYVEDDEEQVLTYSSINSSIATVTSDGIIKGENFGTTQIVVTAIDGTDEIINVHIQEENIPVESMNINAKDFTLEIGNTKKIGVTIKPSKATNQKIVWTSSDNSIATVSQAGEVTGINKGKVTITATTFEDDFTSSITVTIIEKKQIVYETDLKLSSTNENIFVGNTVYIKATIIPNNATDKSVSWESANPNIATVSKGMIQGKGVGTTTIKAITKNKKITKTITVTVKQIELKSLSISDNNVKIGKGGEFSYSLSYNPSNATNKSVTWTSSNPSIASINNKGIVTAHNLGTVTITATSSNGKIAKSTLIVTNENIPAISIKLNSNLYNVKVNGSVGATSIISPSTTTNQKVTWKSNNSNIAKIDANGKIIGIKEGVVRITATTNNGKSASAFVVVKNTNPPVRYLDGSTIKYWVDNTNKNYSISHIWVNNAYNQTKTEIPNKFGTRATPNDLMKRAISKNKGKTIIGINASGFVTENFSKALYNLNNSWKNTSVTPVVIYEGNKIRDYSNYQYAADHRTYGLNKNGELVSFAYSRDPEKNKTVTTNIVNSGIKYTFGFSPVLVNNGQAINGLPTDNNIRQAICQIDKNNFIFITSTISTDTRSSRGLSKKNMANMMVNMGCKTGFNLDGGGSTSLYYVKKGSSSPTKIKVHEGTYGRTVVDILYFVGD